MLIKTEIAAAVNAMLSAAGINKEVSTTVETVDKDVSNLAFTENDLYYGAITASKPNFNRSLTATLYKGVTSEGQVENVSFRLPEANDAPIQLDHVFISSTESNNARIMLTGYKITLVDSE